MRTTRFKSNAFLRTSHSFKKGYLVVHDLVGLFLVLFIAYLVFRLVKVDEFREFKRLGKRAFKKALRRINTRLDQYVNSSDND